MSVFSEAGRTIPDDDDDHYDMTIFDENAHKTADTETLRKIKRSIDVDHNDEAQTKTETVRHRQAKNLTRKTTTITTPMKWHVVTYRYPR